jgi:hypothetical protein
VGRGSRSQWHNYVVHISLLNGINNWICLHQSSGKTQQINKPWS